MSLNNKAYNTYLTFGSLQPQALQCTAPAATATALALRGSTPPYLVYSTDVRLPVAHAYSSNRTLTVQMYDVLTLSVTSPDGTMIICTRDATVRQLLDLLLKDKKVGKERKGKNSFPVE